MFCFHFKDCFCIFILGDLQALLTYFVVFVRIIPRIFKVGYNAFMMELGLLVFFFVLDCTLLHVFDTLLKLSLIDVDLLAARDSQVGSCFTYDLRTYFSKDLP